MALLWLKLLHVTAVSLWLGGLVALPFLLLRQRATDGVEVDRLHHAARLLYLSMISPAAILAVLSGLGLVALGRVAADWFAVKLWLVAGLALMHVLGARQIIGTFGDGPAPSTLLLRASVSVTLGLGFAVVLVVLAKPAMPDLGACLEPGMLGALAQTSVSVSSCGSTANP